MDWEARQAHIAAEMPDKPEMQGSAARRAWLRGWLEQIVVTLPEPRQLSAVATTWCCLPELRSAVTRHLGQCDTCRDRRDDCMARWAPEILPVVAGAELNEQVIEDLRTIPESARPHRGSGGLPRACAQHDSAFIIAHVTLGSSDFSVPVVKLTVGADAIRVRADSGSHHAGAFDPSFADSYDPVDAAATAFEPGTVHIAPS